MSDDEQLTITLMTDWGTGPLWVRVGDEVSAPYGAEEIQKVLPLSELLREAIAAWDERFQATYNADDPRESGILDPETQAAFVADGWDLARQIKAEAPAAVVVAYSPFGQEPSIIDGEG
jgi:hypothetical protein